MMRSPGTITIWKTAHTHQGAENSLDFVVRVEMKRLLHSLAAVLLIILLAGCSTNSHTPTSVLANELVVHYLDVGQGDSEILQCGNQTMLIDAGTNDSMKTLIQDIKDLGITRFDIVVATHPHEDHIGGMDAVIKQFDIGTVYMPDVTTNTVTFSDLLKALQNKNITPIHPATGTVFNLGSAQCTVLAPNSATYTDLNNYSIVIRVVFGSNSFLFTGDAQTQSETEMLAKNYNLKVDVLKVGHHGSDTATSPAFLAAVNPKYAVIEVGAGNDYGHPHAVTLQKLATAGVTVYRTDLNGTITITSDGSNLTINKAKS
jgi:competence protein ComEC